jgi:hypothetical protein
LGIDTIFTATRYSDECFAFILLIKNTKTSKTLQPTTPEFVEQWLKDLKLY